MYGAYKLDEVAYLTTVDEEWTPHTRLMMNIGYHPALGFIIATRVGSSKYNQLLKNPRAALSVYQKSSGEEYTFEATISIDSSRMATHAVYYPGLDVAHFSGPEDETLCVLRINPTPAKHQNVSKYLGDLLARGSH